MGASNSCRVVRFGPFEADVQSGELRKHGVKIRLQDQPFQILLMLLEHPGELVSREQLRQKLWPADTFVDFDHGLNNAVNRVREALSDSAERPRFIETLPRKGYRFIASVNGSENGECPVGSEESGNDLQVGQFAGRRHGPNESNDGGDHGATGAAAAFETPLMPRMSGLQASPKLLEKLAESGRAKSGSRSVGESVSARGTGQRRLWTSRYRGIALAGVGLAALMLVGIVAYHMMPRSTQPRGTLSVTRLTASGSAVQAAISPDGKYVGYFQQDRGHSGTSLWLQQIATQTRSELLPAGSAQPGYEGLRFSGDGNSLYYTRIEPNSPTRSLYRVSVLGGIPQKLLANVPGHFALSPDDRFVAYICPDSEDERDTLVVVPVTGSSKRIIAKLPQGYDGFSDPAWSHDGKLLAVVEHVQDKKLSHLAIVPLNGEPGRRITSDEFSIIGQPAWLTDGSGLVATAFGRWVFRNEQFENEAQYDQLWEFPYRGSAPHRIMKNLLRYHGHISVSADSNMLATVASDLVSAVWVGPASDPDRVRPVTPLSGHYVANRGVTWTGTGKIIYWTNASDAFDLILVDADGANPHTLPRDLPYVLHPEACSDGRTVVYTGASPHQRHVMRRDLDGSRPQTLATGAFPQCSPDSKWVVYYDDMVSGVPLKIPMQGGQPVPLMEEECWRAGISPDGKWIACLGASEKLAIIPFAGGKPVKQFNLPPSFDRSTAPFRWTPDSRSVVYAVDEGGFENLWAQPIAGGASRALTYFTSQEIDYFAFSHDGEQIAIGRGTPSSDVVLISNFR